MPLDLQQELMKLQNQRRTVSITYARKAHTALLKAVDMLPEDSTERPCLQILVQSLQMFLESAK